METPMKLIISSIFILVFSVQQSIAINTPCQSHHYNVRPECTKTCKDMYFYCGVYVQRLIRDKFHNKVTPLTLNHEFKSGCSEDFNKNSPLRFTLPGKRGVLEIADLSLGENATLTDDQYNQTQSISLDYDRSWEMGNDGQYTAFENKGIGYVPRFQSLQLQTSKKYYQDIGSNTDLVWVYCRVRSSN